MSKTENSKSMKEIVADTFCNHLKKELKNKSEKLKEIEDRLYSLNAQISLKWIGMRQTPKDIEITLLNRALGDIIKQIREIRENEQ